MFRPGRYSGSFVHIVFVSAGVPDSGNSIYIVVLGLYVMIREGQDPSMGQDYGCG